MNIQRLFLYNFFFTNIIGLAFLQILPNHEIKLYKESTDTNIEISYSFNLPLNSEILTFTVYSKFNQSISIPIGQRIGNALISIMYSDEMPESFINRLSPTQNGIIIRKLDFETDHEREFSATAIFRKNQNIASSTSPITTLYVRQNPSFINFPSLTQILENTTGIIECMVKSNPSISILRWRLVNLTFRYTIEYPMITPEIKKKFEIVPYSKLSYSYSRFRYQNLTRGQIGHIKCEAISDQNAVFAASTVIDVQYPLNPPEEIETEMISESEVKVKWKRPNLDTGNPGHILTYKVELLNNGKAEKTKYVSHTREETPLFPVISLSEDEDRGWEQRDTQSESLALYNLQPNSEYILRVRVHNGATFSKPSEKLLFKTLQSLHPPTSKWTINRPVLILVIVCSGLFSIMLLMLSVTCFISVKRRKARKWAVLNDNGKKTNVLKDINLVETPLDLNFDDHNIDDGFGSLPPPQLPQSFLQNYQSSGYPSLNHESISVRNLTIQDEIQKSKEQNDSESQTQFATRYISPIITHEPTMIRPSDNRSSLTTNSRASQSSNKTAYV